VRGHNSAWRPLKEPVRDWPLAVCDCRTFDSRRDGVAADVVYHSWVSENVMVHHCEKQEWFFFPEQSPDELLIFRGVNSAQGLDAGGFAISTGWLALLIRRSFLALQGG